MEPRNGRILYLVTLASKTARYGGPTEVARAQAGLARESGFDTTLLAGVIRGDEPPPEPGLLTFRFRRWLPLPGFVGYFSFAAKRDVWRAVGDHDVVHVAFAREAVPLYAALVSVMRKVPLVVQPHGMLTSRTSRLHRCVDVLARPLVARAAAVVAFNGHEAEALEKWLGSRVSPSLIRTIPNPPEEGSGGLAAAPSDDQIPQVLFAARLHPRKRVEDFLAAAAVAQAKGFHARFVVAGPDQGDLSLVESAVSRSTNVAYLGALPRDELHHQIRRSACVVIASRDEPWGQVLVAALRYGVPVVVTASAALAADVIEANAGVVVPDGDAHALADAVEHCVGVVHAGTFAPNRGLIESRFAAEPVAQALAALYRELCSA